MKREKILSNREHWIFEIQNKLYSLIENYRIGKGITRTQLAKEFKVGKSYISQVLNGNFDHKISKLVDLALSCNAVPLIYFINKDEYIQNDKENKSYHLISMNGDCKGSVYASVISEDALGSIRDQISEELIEMKFKDEKPKEVKSSDAPVVPTEFVFPMG